MTITMMIRALEREIALTRVAIARLQLLEEAQKRHASVKVRDRRGRTSMPAHERAQVSERMRKYWEQKRKARTA